MTTHRYDWKKDVAPLPRDVDADEVMERARSMVDRILIVRHRGLAMDMAARALGRGYGLTRAEAAWFIDIAVRERLEQLSEDLRAEDGSDDTQTEDVQ